MATRAGSDSVAAASAEGGFTVNALARLERALAGASRNEYGALARVRASVRRISLALAQQGVARTRALTFLAFVVREHPDRRLLYRRSMSGEATDVSPIDLVVTAAAMETYDKWARACP